MTTDTKRSVTLVNELYSMNHSSIYTRTTNSNTIHAQDTLFIQPAEGMFAYLL